MLGLGYGELLIILVIVLIVFGGKKLPELAKGLGQSVRNFRSAMKEPDESPPREVGPSRERERAAELPAREVATREGAPVRDDDRRG
jgi:TatA/E family protein of Tat protein translocase